VKAAFVPDGLGSSQADLDTSLATAVYPEHKVSSGSNASCREGSSPDTLAVTDSDTVSSRSSDITQIAKYLVCNVVEDAKSRCQDSPTVSPTREIEKIQAVNSSLKNDHMKCLKDLQARVQSEIAHPSLQSAYSLMQECMDLGSVFMDSSYEQHVQRDYFLLYGQLCSMLSQLDSTCFSEITLFHSLKGLERMITEASIHPNLRSVNYLMRHCKYLDIQSKNSSNKDEIRKRCRHMYDSLCKLLKQVDASSFSEEKLAQSLKDLQTRIQSQKISCSSESISILKLECAYLVLEAKDSSNEKEIYTACRHLHGVLCTRQQQIRLQDLEKEIDEQSICPIYADLKRLQTECKDIYRNAVRCVGRAEIEDEAHALYMRLLHIEELSLPKHSSLRRNVSEDDKFLAAVRRNMESYRDLFEQGSQINSPAGSSISRLNKLIVQISKIQVPIPDDKKDLFDQEYAYDMQDDDGVVAPLTEEESKQLQALTVKLMGLEKYGEGVKRHLEFKTRKLWIEQKIAQIREILPMIKNGCYNPSSWRKTPEDELSGCHKSLKWMESNKGVVGHISQTELSGLFHALEQVAEELRQARGSR
jgi:hypothetical protein